VNEAGLWRRVREAINSYPHAQARKLTDAFTAGTPDALYCVDGIAGVLELKYTEWPKRAATLILIELTEEQRAWLEAWERAGGRAYVLLGVGKNWFLLRMEEIPLAPVPWKAPRVTREFLDGVLRSGRGGTFKDMNGLLPATLAQLPGPR